MPPDYQQASRRAQAFTDLYLHGRHSANQGDFLTAKKCFEQLIDKRTPSDFFGYFKTGPDGTPTSMFALYKCSIIEADGTETFAENCTFVIDACQRLAQLPDISAYQAAEFLDIAGKRIKNGIRDPDLALEIKAAMEPFREKNEQLKYDVERRQHDEFRQAAEIAEKRIQDTMALAHHMFDPSHNTMTPGHFGTTAQGLIPDTLSFPAQIPDRVPAPVQLDAVFPATPSNPTWNASDKTTNISSLSPRSGNSIFSISSSMNTVSAGFPAHFQPNQEQGRFSFEQVQAEIQFDVGAPPFVPDYEQSPTGGGQGFDNSERSRESHTGQRQAYGLIDRNHEQSSGGKWRPWGQDGKRHGQQAYARVAESQPGSEQVQSQAPTASGEYGLPYDQTFGLLDTAPQSNFQELVQPQYGQIQAQPQTFQNPGFPPGFQGQMQGSGAYQGLSLDSSYPHYTAPAEHDHLSLSMYGQQSSSRHPPQEELQINHNRGQHQFNSSDRTQGHWQSESQGSRSNSRDCVVAPPCTLSMHGQHFSSRRPRQEELQINHNRGQSQVNPFDQPQRHSQSVNQGSCNNHCVIVPHCNLPSSYAMLALQPPRTQDQQSSQSMDGRGFGQSQQPQDQRDLQSVYQCPLNFPHDCPVACAFLPLANDNISPEQFMDSDMQLPPDLLRHFTQQ